MRGGEGTLTKNDKKKSKGVESQETEIEVENQEPEGEKVVEQEEVVPVLAPGGGKLPCKYCDKSYSTKFAWQRHG